jgi:hypothetical protein
MPVDGSLLNPPSGQEMAWDLKEKGRRLMRQYVRLRMRLVGQGIRLPDGVRRTDPDMPLAAPAAIPTCHWRRPPRSRHDTGGARRDPDMTLAAPRSRHATGGARSDPDMTLAAPAAIPTGPEMPLAAQRKLVPPCALLRGRLGRFLWRAPSSGDGWEGFSDFVATMRGGGAHMGRQAHAFLQQCLGRVDTKCGRCHGHATSETSRGGRSRRAKR